MSEQVYMDADPLALDEFEMEKDTRASATEEPSKQVEHKKKLSKEKLSQNPLQNGKMKSSVVKKKKALNLHSSSGSPPDPNRKQESRASAVKANAKLLTNVNIKSTLKHPKPKEMKKEASIPIDKIVKGKALPVNEKTKVKMKVKGSSKETQGSSKLSTGCDSSKQTLAVANNNDAVSSQKDPAKLQSSRKFKEQKLKKSSNSQNYGKQNTNNIRIGLDKKSTKKISSKFSKLRSEKDISQKKSRHRLESPGQSVLKHSEKLKKPHQSSKKTSKSASNNEIRTDDLLGAKQIVPIKPTDESSKIPGTSKSSVINMRFAEEKSDMKDQAEINEQTCISNNAMQTPACINIKPCSVLIGSRCYKTGTDNSSPNKSTPATSMKVGDLASTTTTVINRISPIQLSQSECCLPSELEKDTQSENCSKSDPSSQCSSDQPTNCPSNLSSPCNSQSNVNIKPCSVVIGTRCSGISEQVENSSQGQTLVNTSIDFCRNQGNEVDSTSSSSILSLTKTNHRKNNTSDGCSLNCESASPSLIDLQEAAIKNASSTTSIRKKSHYNKKASKLNKAVISQEVEQSSNHKLGDRVGKMCETETDRCDPLAFTVRKESPQSETIANSDFGNPCLTDPLECRQQKVPATTKQDHESNMSVVLNKRSRSNKRKDGLSKTESSKGNFLREESPQMETILNSESERSYMSDSSECYQEKCEKIPVKTEPNHELNISAAKSVRSNHRGHGISKTESNKSNFLPSFSENSSTDQDKTFSKKSASISVKSRPDKDDGTSKSSEPSMKFKKKKRNDSKPKMEPDKKNTSIKEDCFHGGRASKSINSTFGDLPANPSDQATTSCSKDQSHEIKTSKSVDTTVKSRKSKTTAIDDNTEKEIECQMSSKSESIILPAGDSPHNFSKDALDKDKSHAGKKSLRNSAATQKIKRKSSHKSSNRITRTSEAKLHICDPSVSPVKDEYPESQISAKIDQADPCVQKSFSATVLNSSTSKLDCDEISSKPSKFRRKSCKLDDLDGIPEKIKQKPKPNNIADRKFEPKLDISNPLEGCPEREVSSKSGTVFSCLKDLETFSPNDPVTSQLGCVELSSETSSSVKDKSLSGTISSKLNDSTAVPKHVKRKSKQKPKYTTDSKPESKHEVSDPLELRKDGRPESSLAIDSMAVSTSISSKSDAHETLSKPFTSVKDKSHSAKKSVILNDLAAAPKEVKRKSKHKLNYKVGSKSETRVDKCSPVDGCPGSEDFSDLQTCSSKEPITSKSDSSKLKIKPNNSTNSESETKLKNCDHVGSIKEKCLKSEGSSMLDSLDCFTDLPQSSCEAVTKQPKLSVPSASLKSKSHSGKNKSSRLSDGAVIPKKVRCKPKNTDDSSSETHKERTSGTSPINESYSDSQGSSKPTDNVPFASDPAEIASNESVSCSITSQLDHVKASPKSSSSTVPIKVKPSRRRSPSRKQTQSMDNIQERCCNHWFPNHRSYLNHLAVFSEETEKVHLQKLKDLQMKKCKRCTKWVEKSAYVGHMKHSHKVIIKFKASKKKSKACPLSKREKPPVDEETFITCFLSGNKLMKVSSVLDLPFHMKPILMVEKISFIEKLVQDQVFSCKSSELEVDEVSTPLNSDYEPPSGNASDFEAELHIDESQLSKKVPKKLAPKVKPQRHKQKAQTMEESSNIVQSKKASKKKKTDAVVPSASNKKHRVLNKSGFYDDFNSDGESDHLSSNSDYFSEFETMDTEETENVPTVELDLFTLDSAQEDMSVYLRDPHNPDFKVYANYNAIFVGDSALEDVTNQSGYVTDNNNVVYVSPGHFLFPELEETIPDMKNRKMKSISNKIKKKISATNKGIPAFGKIKSSPIKISKKAKVFKQDKENSTVNQNASKQYSENLLQDELSNFNDWLSADKETPKLKSPRKIKKNSNKEDVPYVFHLDSSEVDILPMPSVSKSSAATKTRKVFENYELNGEKVVIISSSMRPPGVKWPLKKKRASRKVPICTIVGSAREEANIILDQAGNSLVGNFVVKEDQSLSPVPSILPPDLDLDESSLFFDKEDLPMNPSDLFPKEFSLDSLLEEIDNQDNGELPAKNSSLVSSVTISKTPTKSKKGLEDALESGEQGLAYIDANGQLRSPSGRLMEESNKETVVDEWAAIADAVESYAHTLPPIDPEPSKSSPCRSNPKDPLQKLSLWDTPLVMSDEFSFSPKKINTLSPRKSLSMSNRPRKNELFGPKNIMGHSSKTSPNTPLSKPKLKIPKPSLKIPKPKSLLHTGVPNDGEDSSILSNAVSPSAKAKSSHKKLKHDLCKQKSPKKQSSYPDSGTTSSPLKNNSIKFMKKRRITSDEIQLSESPKKLKMSSERQDNEFTSIEGKKSIPSPGKQKRKYIKKVRSDKSLGSPNREHKNRNVGSSSPISSSSKLQSPTSFVKPKRKHVRKSPSSSKTETTPSTTPLQSDVHNVLESTRKYKKRVSNVETANASFDAEMTTAELFTSESNLVKSPKKQKSPKKMLNQERHLHSPIKRQADSKGFTHLLSPKAPNSKEQLQLPNSPSRAKKKNEQRSQTMATGTSEVSSESNIMSSKSKYKKRSQISTPNMAKSLNNRERLSDIDGEASTNTRISDSKILDVTKIISQSNIRSPIKTNNSKRKRHNSSVNSSTDEPPTKKSKRTALDDVYNDVFSTDFEFSKEFIGFDIGSEPPEKEMQKPVEPPPEILDFADESDSSEIEDFLGFEASPQVLDKKDDLLPISTDKASSLQSVKLPEINDNTPEVVVKPPKNMRKKAIQRNVVFSPIVSSSKTKRKYISKKSKSPSNMKDIRSYFVPVQKPQFSATEVSIVDSNIAREKPTQKKTMDEQLPLDLWKTYMEESFDGTPYLQEDLVECHFEGFQTKSLKNLEDNLEILLRYVDVLRIPYIFDASDYTTSTDELYDYDEEFVNSQL